MLPMRYLIRVLAFGLILAVYYGMDWLNHVQVAKSLGMGMVSILTVSAWTGLRGREGLLGRVLDFIVVLSFLCIIAFQAFLRDIFGVGHDDLMIMEALFNTSGDEASEFILQNIFYMGKHFLVLVAAAVFYWFVLRFRNAGPVRLKRGGKVRWRFAAAVTAVFCLVHLNPVMRKENPFLFFPIRHAKWERRVAHIQNLQGKIASAALADSALASMTYSGKGPRTVVFVIGEATARHNWSLYGYGRKTNPRLEELGDSLVRFTDVVTNKGSTVQDIEALIGPATQNDPRLFERTPDLLTMAGKVGYKTWWITNHTTDVTGTLAIIAHHADVTINTNKGGSRGEGSHDEVVLPRLEDALRDPAPLKFIVLHLLGGHPAFYFRYPDEYAVFNDAQDEVARELEEAGRSYFAVKARNYYDNAMLYADHVLRETIELTIRESSGDAAWLFVPDHGEDVAHYTNYAGHNNRVLTMFEIPMLFWFSRSFPLEVDDFGAVTDRPYQTDLLDHTLLGLLGIRGDYYNPAHDILAPGFEPSPRTVAGKPYPWKE